MTNNVFWTDTKRKNTTRTKEKSNPKNPCQSRDLLHLKRMGYLRTNESTEHIY